MKFLLCLTGLVLIIEGLPYFVFPDRIKTYLMKVAETPDSTLRVLGFISVLIGLSLVYFGRM
ncbi:MAG: DUF2065 domain-containing protein [Syntrophales bacterium]|jgi:uncharacterized protein YjeT (DUF2065 family)|nr:DUF2065 domain-containing protein [Syntrophales bacterium]MDY0043925.1 DUF2065 domain-containing protein [Syntrophales bacterium]